MDTLGRAITWTLYNAHRATYPLRYASNASSCVACYTWDHLWVFDARTRQRLFHTSRVSHNDNVSFCRLPEDVLVLIFDFVKSSGRFGEGVVDSVQRLRGTSIGLQDVQPEVPPYIGDLYACVLVCRTWSEPAARALWRHVSLRTSGDCVAFATSTSAHVFASAIRRLDLQYVAKQSPIRGTARLQRMVYNLFRPAPSVPDHVELLCRCYNLSTVVLTVRRVEREIRDIQSLATLKKLSELRIIGYVQYVPFDSFYCFKEPGHFVSLVSLHLQNIRGYEPDTTHEITLHGLGQLSLEASIVSPSWLHVMLQSARQLRVVELRDIVICRGSSKVLETVLDGAPYTQLERLVTIGLSIELLPYRNHTLGELGDMQNWNVLTSLTIQGRLLSTLLEPPPRLKHLSLVYQIRYYGKLRSRESIFKRISKIKRTLERIRVGAPGLKVVDLWHPVTVGTEWQAWLLAAFLLHGTCSRLGIELNINLV